MEYSNNRNENINIIEQNDIPNDIPKDIPNDMPNDIPKIKSWQEYMDKIILTYPIYYNIFQKYYSGNKDISRDLNRIYQPIFIGLMEYYPEFMTVGIEQIIKTINTKYKPESTYAVIDYIEYLFGNILYETFLTEIKKINPESISYEYLCVFEYIIRVELVKYRLYQETLSKLVPGSKIISVMEYRIENCLRKISFGLGYLEKNYSKHDNVIRLCKNLISESGFHIENKIDIDIIDSIDSFIKINKNK
jgi:hypothetical protein